MPSNFLRGEDVKPGMIVEILDEGEFIDKDASSFGRPAFRIRVRLPDGEEKIWTMNRTTQDNLAKAYGDDTANWKGKKVRLETSVYNIRGQLRQGIIGFPVVSEEDAVMNELKDLVENIRKTGLREVTMKDFSRFLTIKGLKISPEEAVKKLGLKVVGDVVHIS